MAKAKSKDKDTSKDLAKALQSMGIRQVKNLTDTSVPWFPLKSLTITDLFGKGLPKGRIVEVYGPNSSGKSTLATYLVAEVQKSGYACGYCDVEHALDLDHARDLGCDVDNLYFSQPSSAEEACTVIENMVNNIPNCGVIVLDSIAMMSPQIEIDSEYGKANMGVLARLMGTLTRKITPILTKKNVTLICINQIRMKIGVTFGNPETTPGGNAMPFASSIRVDLRKREFLGDKERPIGMKSHIKVTKNKVGPPLRTSDITWFFADGLDLTTELIDFATKHKVLELKGAWYKYKGENIGNGARKTKDYLLANPKIYKEIDKATRAKMFEKPSEVDKDKVVEKEKTILTEENKENKEK